MPKRSCQNTPEIVDLTKDGEVSQDVQVPPQVQPIQPVQAAVTRQPPLLVDLTEDVDGVVVSSWRRACLPCQQMDPPL